MVEIPASGMALDAYLALPGTHRAPGVIVIQEWWGLVPHIRTVCDRLAEEGFVALAPDLYRGAATTEPDEAHKLMMGLRLRSLRRISPRQRTISSAPAASPPTGWVPWVFAWVGVLRCSRPP